MIDGKGLLGRDDPSPVIALNQGGRAPFLLLGDHAGRAIPVALGDLGLPAGAMDLHIAWDIGIAGLGERLSALLDAPFVRQAYSRLVIDCNRTPGRDDAIPEVSDRIAIPGNVGLLAANRVARVAQIHAPYQAAIAGLIGARKAAGMITHLISLHSFTPVFQGFVRPWRYGVLHRGDSAFSTAVLRLLRAELGQAAGDNQPYSMDDIDHTIPFHADGESLDYLELETRQDLIADAAGQDEAAAFIADLLTRAVRALG